MVPPVTNPTALPAGQARAGRAPRPRRRPRPRCAAGVTVRSPAFWSHALVSQSAASAAGWVPPITNPKNRPDGIAVSPGSQASASRSTTVGRVGRAVREVATEPLDQLGHLGPGRDVAVGEARPARSGRGRGRARAPRRPWLRRPCGHPRTLVGCPSRLCPPAVWRAAGRGARGAAGAVRRAAPGPAPGGRAAPGPRLPVHLLLPAAGAAAPLAPRVRRPAARRAGVRRAEGVRRRRRVTACVRRVAAAAPRGDPAAARGDRRAAGPHRLLRAARVGDGLPAADETRHPQPLRLGGAGTDTVVESHRIACSHFDAFRFFTDDARPRNTLSARPRRPARRSSSRAASTPGWTSTSTPSG